MKKFTVLLTSALISFYPLSSQEPEKVVKVEETTETPDPQVFSKALGYSFAKGLIDDHVFNFDIQSVVEGIQDAISGKPAPLTESEYEKAFDVIQQKYLSEMSTAGLDQANTFLKENISNPGVVEIIPGKLQMTVLHTGDGKTAISASDSPLIEYTGKYLDETIISSEGEPVEIPLEQTFPGIKQGLIGAKQGEQRRLYIHPELGPEPSDISIPNSLMIIDIKVIETDSKKPS